MTESFPSFIERRRRGRISAEVHGQIVTVDVLRSLLFLRRVRIVTTEGKYFLAWVPRWRVFDA